MDAQLLESLQLSHLKHHLPRAISWLNIKSCLLKQYNDQTGQYQTQCWVPVGDSSSWSFVQPRWSLLSWLRIRLWLAQALWSSAVSRPNWELPQTILIRIGSRLLHQSLQDWKRDWRGHAQYSIQVQHLVPESGSESAEPDKVAVSTIKSEWAKDVLESQACPYSLSSAGHLPNSDLKSMVETARYLTDTVMRDPTWSRFLIPRPGETLDRQSPHAQAQASSVYESLVLHDLCAPTLREATQYNVFENWIPLWCTSSRLTHRQVVYYLYLTSISMNEHGCVAPASLCRTTYWMYHVLLLKVEPIDGCYQWLGAYSRPSRRGLSPFTFSWKSNGTHPKLSNPGYTKRAHVARLPLALSKPDPLPSLLETLRGSWTSLHLVWNYAPRIQHVSMDQVAEAIHFQVQLRPISLLVTLPNHVDKHGEALPHSVDGWRGYLHHDGNHVGRLLRLDLSGLVGIPLETWAEMGSELRACTQLNYLKLRLRPGNQTTETSRTLEGESYGLAWTILDTLEPHLTHLITEHQLRTLVLEYRSQSALESRRGEQEKKALLSMERTLTNWMDLPRRQKDKPSETLYVSWVWNPYLLAPHTLHKWVNQVGDRIWIVSPDEALSLGEKALSKPKQKQQPKTDLFICTSDEYELHHFSGAYRKNTDRRHQPKHIVERLRRDRTSSSIPSVKEILVVRHPLKVHVSHQFFKWTSPDKRSRVWFQPKPKPKPKPQPEHLSSTCRACPSCSIRQRHHSPSHTPRSVLPDFKAPSKRRVYHPRYAQGTLASSLVNPVRDPRIKGYRDPLASSSSSGYQDVFAAEPLDESEFSSFDNYEKAERLLQTLEPSLGTNLHDDSTYSPSQPAMMEDMEDSSSYSPTLPEHDSKWTPIHPLASETRLCKRKRNLTDDDQEEEDDSNISPPIHLDGTTDGPTWPYTPSMTDDEFINRMGSDTPPLEDEDFLAHMNYE